MSWDNPFSFKGRVGRARFWLTMFILNVIALALSVFPVTAHTIVLGTFGGWGESSISYATPMEPVTAQSWVLFAIFYLLTTAILWIAAAAMVKRQRDIGRSARWMAYFLGALAVSTAWEAALSRPGAPLSIFEIANMIFLVPFIAIAAWRMMEMLFVRGETATSIKPWEKASQA